VLPAALATILRLASGAVVGVVLALFIASGIYSHWPAVLAVICVGASIGAYLSLRYGDRFIVWVLRFWNQPGE
jgi:hypothetical protein